ncbi:S41 family peptidase, partial [Patescibacteria group bacterium]|nr:S41 family peptidase [Patescibacteria group bacterium]
RNGILTIVSPLRSSPAERAGLKPNDEILKADGVDLTDMPFLDAVNHVRGPKGTTVELTIRRSGTELKIKVVRDEVKVPEIEITWQGKIALVKLMQFGKTTENELRGALEEVQSQGPSGVIVDLRSNPGGLLHAANLVISNFVPKGTKVAEIISRDGTRTDETTDMPTIRSDVPVVVLVNEGSASASEIVAGALQDYGRATVVGTKTFGKGTVQQIIRFNDESGLKITIAEWKTPDGRKIDGVGVRPDVAVEYKTERDEQMLKALEILR